MDFYLQCDIPAEVPAFGGDHLLIFQCVEHDEACFPPGPGTVQLPSRFWEHPPPPNEGAFWRILLQREGVPMVDAAPLLHSRRLRLEMTPEEVNENGNGSHGFKVGGVPSWAQAPEHYRCPCGADLAFVCQIPENHEFDLLPEREDDDYGEMLFLGNEIYIFACPEHCDPAAAWPVNQN
ncbi:hypothetical protein GCM10010182_06200 [Actinomadura cremea]|nr:hypothetical protein GCM10010182_06200 [Actinomadura cremea]